MDITEGVIDYISSVTESFVDSVPARTQIIPNNNYRRDDNTKLAALYLHLFSRGLRDFFTDWYQEAFTDSGSGFIGGIIDDQDGFQTCARVWNPNLMDLCYGS